MQPIVSDLPLASTWGAARRWWSVRGLPGAVSSPRIGLAGVNSPWGLGHQNRDLARQLKVATWLAPWTDDSYSHEPSPVCEFVPRQPGRRLLGDWLSAVDVVLFVERPPVAGLLELARGRRVPVVCVPNWEWIHPETPWLKQVDLMLCPTRHTFDRLQLWKQRLPFPWQVEHVPWPIDLARFKFRKRSVCRRFVFVGGNGGFRASLLRQPQTIVQRKGLSLLLAAAELLPQCSFLVHTAQVTGRVGSNVELRSPAKHNGRLYDEGDVCVQPSYWEGLGLPLLECQAAGMPLITTDAAPMNEHHPLATIPSRGINHAWLGGQQVIPIPIIQIESVVEVLKRVHAMELSSASLRARQFIEIHHNWKISRERILEKLATLVATYGG